MASLHHRPSRGDPFRPSTAPYHSTARPKSPFPREIYTTASLPPHQLAMAPQEPSTPPLPAAGMRRRGGICGGGGVRGVRVGCFGDPEMKRRRRVAGYKVYAVEGKVKASIRRGLRWFKRKCSGILSF
ncbi:hypothetical protein SEVIR_5G023733v4 [Setaria viridis]|uniref:DUF3511 domain-containing protein n=2 Tax=Setaria TaxID=4554 RepID=A0A368R0K5_SETIT|nr:uncharacterized protein LOC105914342 [Setaria italica]XP_034593419.1 uncharacterized protein LOC117855221 [Setaria viridis]RCV23663.1 hypothetical protein SETIT_5G024900v2 [Setaria italica]TKW12234.1 hypothetical protein SEVIR_5G023733v2 [Setaria viridis]